MKRQTGNRAIAVALLRELASGSEIQKALAVAREAAPLFGEADAWMPEESLAALLGNAKVDRALARRVGRSVMRSTEAGVLVRYGGMATPEKAYRRCDELLAREVADGRYVVVHNRSGRSRILFHTDLSGPVDGVFCGIRVGMLEAIPTVFGLFPAEVEETHCAAKGDSCCLYEVRYTLTHRSGLAGGALGGVVLGGTLAALAGLGFFSLAVAVLAFGVLGALAGRGFDLARQLDAVGGARHGQLAIADYLDSALAEKMDRFARLDSLDRSVHRSPSFPGVSALRPELNDFCQLVRRAVRESRDRLPPELEIEFDLPGEEIEFVCDALQMEMLVLALLRNVTAVQGERVHASVSARRVTEGVLFCISDDGPGLEDERADAAFDPYVAESNLGAGDREMGLQTACRIVEDHGGELRVESAPGSGNRVTALLLEPVGVCAGEALG